MDNLFSSSIKCHSPALKEKPLGARQGGEKKVLNVPISSDSSPSSFEEKLESIWERYCDCQAITKDGFIRKVKDIVERDHIEKKKIADIVNNIKFNGNFLSYEITLQIFKKLGLER